MLAGGEEYFQPPEPIDHDSLTRFAAWCRRLRTLEKPGKKALDALCREAEEVGNAMHVKEIVAGTLLRAIKQSSGVKRHAYWCLLDMLAKTYKETFGFLFELHLADVGADCMDWDDPNLAPKYESLLEHWGTLFDEKLIQDLWGVRRKEKLWAARHPEEARRQRQEEEAAWDREIEGAKDEEGLGGYGEPCLAYLQGRCDWGDKCPQLHPPGLEGSLPPESRAGDWRCPSCGTINRHFRRRCFSCPVEKPQYKKGGDYTKTPEVVAACKAEEKFFTPLATQFGYDPNDEEAAIKFWTEKLASPAQVDYIQTRRQKYQSQILPKILESSITRVTQDGEDNNRRRERPANNLPATSTSSTSKPTPSNNTTKQFEISVNASLLSGSAIERVSNLSTALLEDGVHASSYKDNLFMLSKSLSEVAASQRTAAASSSGGVDENVSLIFSEVCRMVHTAWLASGKKRPHLSVTFFNVLGKDLAVLPFLTEEHRTSVKGMVDSVMA